jgi:hypothetical protein
LLAAMLPGVVSADSDGSNPNSATVIKGDDCVLVDVFEASDGSLYPIAVFTGRYVEVVTRNGDTIRVCRFRPSDHTTAIPPETMFQHGVSCWTSSGETHDTVDLVTVHGNGLFRCYIRD